MKLTTTFTRLALGSAIMLASLGSVQAQEDEVKIGFIVKKPEQAWFINEQEAATAAGEELGFEVVRLGGEDGQEVLSAIDNLYSQRCRRVCDLPTGCTPRARDHEPCRAVRYESRHRG